MAFLSFITVTATPTCLINLPRTLTVLLFLHNHPVHSVSVPQHRWTPQAFWHSMNDTSAPTQAASHVPWKSKPIDSSFAHQTTRSGSLSILKDCLKGFSLCAEARSFPRHKSWLRTRGLQPWHYSSITPG